MRNTDGQWDGEERPEDVRHIGRVLISTKTIMEWVRMQEGTLMDIEVSRDAVSPGIMFKIEHPDMPPVKEGQIVPIVYPAYTYMTCEHNLTVYDREEGPMT